MNSIRKMPLGQLGYGFIDPEFLPEGQDEYYLRNRQNRTGIDYRHLTAYEIEVLVRNRNASDNWNNILVSDAFNPELVKNCKFYGLVRIGKLEPYFLEYSRLQVAVGLYNSTIISCDFGDNVVVNNVNYLSHYVIGNEVILVNVNELITTPYAKFGVGIVKEGEPEAIRIWMELCNENGGRKVLPFTDMLPADAWLWTRNRTNKKLMDRFVSFTEKQYDTKRGYYGKIGDRTVIKNCAIIKDCWIGSDAYLKGANKLKNLTINSSPEEPSQIGEGCEMVNGIVGFGCRIFYGVKAVRFVMASQSQLKYGARLINSYLGNNATISCCEVLNSLIFPGHEQHHNNSFLCASLIMGQSNMAAGATIGSNHNSRSADGELVAGRGFWPGLCVSLKHNSRFASFTLIAKGDYPAELDIPLPFSLVSQDTAANELIILPGYWFMYNMYALARNAWKYEDRDKRKDKLQKLEFDYLAPDTIQEIKHAMGYIETAVGKYLHKDANGSWSEEEYRNKGRKYLQQPEAAKIDKLPVSGMENTSRPTVLIKSVQGYKAYSKQLRFFAISALLRWLEAGHHPETWEEYAGNIEVSEQWINLGGQLVQENDLTKIITDIESGIINGWPELQERYFTLGAQYDQQKMDFGLQCFTEIMGRGSLNPTLLNDVLNEAIQMKKEMVNAIESSRKKDYTNPFRKMLYESAAEMDEVLGSMEDNGFILQEKASLEKFIHRCEQLKSNIQLSSV